jgi:flagellar biosynthesis protein FlhF
MRLKIFTAATLAEAMARVRREMGEDAIIVSTQMDARSARVTAAMEEPDPPPVPWDVSEDSPMECWEEEAPRASQKSASQKSASQKSTSQKPGKFAEAEIPSQAGGDGRGSATNGGAEVEIRQALSFHGVPLPLTQRLVRAAATLHATGALMALAGALDRTFGFAPLSHQAEPRPLMLIGPPGAGKTLTVAKLATRARRAGHTATVITTDTRRAGGVGQLEAFTRILGIDLIAAASPAEVAAALRRRDESGGDGPILIDTAGANPLIGQDISQLAELVDLAAAEAILVLPAGGDAMEMMDTAAAFACLRIRSLLATRLDAVRRLGSLLAAVDAGRTSFSDGGISHRVVDSLVPLNPVALSRALLPHAANKPSSSPFSEASP